MNYISDFLLHTPLHCLPLSLSLSQSFRAAQSAASLLQSATWLGAACASNCHVHIGANIRGSGRGRQHAQSPAGLESQCSRRGCCRRCRGCGLVRIVVILLVGSRRCCRSIVDAAHEGPESGTHLCGLWRH